LLGGQVQGAEEFVFYRSQSVVGSPKGQIDLLSGRVESLFVRFAQGRHGSESVFSADNAMNLGRRSSEDGSTVNISRLNKHCPDSNFLRSGPVGREKGDWSGIFGGERGAGRLF
jgi:hypothetical protein